ncbi:Sulfatase [seawater metagenome]|uniref:Sulfatase n=1 Tax=seawater metagenome TaxID=1561972 RepID=A0A5E8CML0_9ZZZZ
MKDKQKKVMTGVALSGLYSLSKNINKRNSSIKKHNLIEITLCYQDVSIQYIKKEIEELINIKIHIVSYYIETDKYIKVEFLGTVDLSEIPKNLNVKILAQFTSADSYNYLVKPKKYHHNSSYSYLYLCPTKTYAEIIMKSNPLINKKNYEIVFIESIPKTFVFHSNDPYCELARLYYDTQESININPVIKRDKTNVILIMFDQFNAWSNLPESFTKNLRGYQSFKKRGIEFTNMTNNRQMCSPSRSVIMSGMMNTGVLDNIDQKYQADSISNINNLNTIGKVFKSEGYDITCYYGKSHFDFKLSDNFTAPRFNIDTTEVMKIIGFDRHNEYGDDFYNPQHGFYSDHRSFMTHSIIGTDKEVYDIEIDGIKYQGMLPFLMARAIDNKSYHAQFHFTDPHDAMHIFHNPQQTPNSDVMQWAVPFWEQQIEEFGVNNMYYNKLAEYCVSKNSFFNKNYFEDNWEDYKNNAESLLYYESFINDFVTDTDKVNSIYPFLEGAYYGLKMAFTMADKSDIVFWKNFQNLYLSMIQYVDDYLFQLYDFMDKNNMFSNTGVIISADHGEMAGSHGLKQKGLPYKNSTNVPCLICAPNLNPELLGTTNSTIINTYDINPTLACLGGNYKKLDRMIGMSLLSLDKNNTLVVNEKLANENFGIINNWMNWSTGIPYVLTNNDTTNVLNPIQSVMDYQFMCFHSLKEINGIQYNYVIWWSINTIIKNQKKQLSLKELLKLTNHTDLFTLLESLEPSVKNLKPKHLQNIKNILNKNHTNIYSLIHKIKEATELNKFLKLFLELFILSLVPFVFQKTQNIDIKADIQQKRSNLISMELPFLNKSHCELQNQVNEGQYLEMLFNRNDDPSESYNLMDPKNEITNENNLIAEQIFLNICDKAESLGIGYTKTPIISPIALNLLCFLINIINSGKDKLNNVENNILMSFMGENNMDSPFYELIALKQISQIKS